MPTYTNKIIEVKRLSNARGEYLEIKVDANGKTLEKKIYGAAVKEITVPGDYECEVEKINGYNVITRARLLSAGHSFDAESPRSSVKTPEIEPYNTNRAILVQVCIKSAAEVYQGLGKSNDDICHLAKRLLDFADKALSTKIEEVEF